MNEIYVVFEISPNGYERVAGTVRTEREAKRILDGVKKRQLRAASKDTVIYRKYINVEIDTHSISAGGSSTEEMEIELKEVMRAFARIGSGSGVSITADNLKLS